MKHSFFLSLLFLAACGASGDGDGYNGNGTEGTQGPSPNIGQGGSQDFGLFRDILESGGIPGPETIDDVGFFNEHHIDLPAPECAEDICIHGMLGVLGNLINGMDCTVVLVGMNTPLDPATLERPMLNLSVVIDTSGSMSGSIEDVRVGLDAMLDGLEPEDRIHLVTFDTEAVLVAEGVPGDSDDLPVLFDNIEATGQTNLYAGLREGFEAVDRNRVDGVQNRVLLLSDGAANVGIVDSDHIVALAEAYAQESVSLSTIGLGSGFDVDLMSTLAEQGSGAFYFVEDSQAVQEVFREEIEAFLVPLAEQAEIRIEVDPGFHLGGFYGSNLVDLESDAIDISIPTLQLAHRTGDDDNTMGRRGGGGAMVAELLPLNGTVAGPVGHVSLDYLDPLTGEVHGQEIDLIAPSEADDPGGWFAEDSVAKSFVMLNIYVGFDMAARDAEAGRYPEALAVLGALEVGVTDWLSTHGDADIADDLVYITLFIENIEQHASIVLEPEWIPGNPWPSD